MSPFAASPPVITPPGFGCKGLFSRVFRLPPPATCATVPGTRPRVGDVSQERCHATGSPRVLELQNLLQADQVSSGQFFGDVSIESLLEFGKVDGEDRGFCGARVVQFGKAGAQEPLVSAAVEQGGLKPEGREAIALGLGDALNEAMQTQAAQVVA